MSDTEVSDYKVVNGFIVSPGKFEGEPAWVPTLHELVLAGMADHSVHDGSMAIDAFELDADTARMTGLDARPGVYVCLWTDDQGFVNHMIMTENELFACEGFDVEEPTTDFLNEGIEGFSDYPEYDSGY
jgi:hypothetical protein